MAVSYFRECGIVPSTVVSVVMPTREMVENGALQAKVAVNHYHYLIKLSLDKGTVAL